MLGHLLRIKQLDSLSVVTIMAVFYKSPVAMTLVSFSRAADHSIILRTKDHAGAKSTPNTPIILQEIK